MIRALVRLVGLVILAAAFIFLIYDGTKSIADRTFFITRTVDVWSGIHQASLVALEPWMETNIAPWAWNPGMVTVINQPAWLALGIIGIVLVLLGRKKRELIGYSR